MRATFQLPENLPVVVVLGVVVVVAGAVGVAVAATVRSIALTIVVNIIAIV